MSVQLDLFAVLPNAAIVADLADAGPYPCDRCGKEAEDLASPNGDQHAMWCTACRSIAEVCCCCGDEIDVGKFECRGCRAYAVDMAHHYGDD